MNREILIIGGGPAGLECANSLISLGYKVFIVEKSAEPGGHLRKWDRLFPYGASASETLEKLLQQSNKALFFYETEVKSIKKSDGVFIATLSDETQLHVGSIVVATGFSLFPAAKKEEYGYGIYNGVITNADLEDAFKTGKKEFFKANRVGFVHCVGSRDEKVCNRHCSKVCCVTAVKQACEFKDLNPEAEVYCFYMDLRMFGRGYEDLYLKAQNKYGIRFIRGRVSEVAEDVDGCLVLKAEDTLTSRPLKVTLDLLVLMSGISKNPDNDEIALMLGIDTDEDGFLSLCEPNLNNNKTQVEGVFLTGSVTGPKTLPETLNEARAAALAVHKYLSR
ncbi:MAG: FAD-dependent oxidoreductase [Bacteroidales bacterium]|nr:FAD-dependent oxidoreductase [Bacteroidales bacterium]